MIGFMVFKQQDSENEAEFIQLIDAWLEENDIVDVFSTTQSLDLHGRIVVSFFYEKEIDEDDEKEF